MKRLFAGIRGWIHPGRDPHANLRERLALAAIATIIVDGIGSILVLMFERDADGSKITNIGDSLFWTTTQLLTVSSQLPNPLTTGGRITDVFLEAFAITVVAAIAGTFADYLNHLRQQSSERS